MDQKIYCRFQGIIGAQRSFHFGLGLLSFGFIVKHLFLQKGKNFKTGKVNSMLDFFTMKVSVQIKPKRKPRRTQTQVLNQTGKFLVMRLMKPKHHRIKSHQKGTLQNH